MIKAVTLLLALALACLPPTAYAEPIKLKLSFFTSDRTLAYQSAVQPFVEAINSEGKDLIEIEVYLSGALGKVQSELPQLVLGGVADIAFIVPGRNPDRFLDNGVVELPGLFLNVREATLAYTRLVAADALAGYKEFFVIGAFATEPETIHSRKRLESIADLKGQKIRANNLTEATGLASLGALPVVLAFNETSPALSSGLIDGAAVPMAQLFDTGIGRLVNHHYLLETSAAPLTLMMNRAVFERLPEKAKSLIVKYSGEWAAARYSEAFERVGNDVLKQIRADSRRSVVVPSPADLDAAHRAFKSIAREWTENSAHNRDLVKQVETELTRIRSAQ
jgi:TRAP-type C4-dicarboxylate transport system substrate-binding protein